MARAPRIQGWDQRHCDSCRRTRVHYRANNKWHCNGTLRSVLDIVAKCGDPVKGVSSEPK